MASDLKKFNMKLCLLLVLFSYFVSENVARVSYISRVKRDSSGALHIVTNHAEPIHADVKSENNDNTEKPCNGSILPDHIEPGAVFKVTAPSDALYEPKSLRKSSPLVDKLDVVRSISRVTTLAVLLISAVLEFYPLLEHLCSMIYQFVYM